jgi:predicted esterase
MPGGMTTAERGDLPVGARLARGLALSLASIAATVAFGATALALAAGAWTWVQLGVALLVVFVGGGVALVFPRRRRLRLALLIVALLGVARIVAAALPRTPVVNAGALVKTRYARAGDTRLLWAGIPESETVALGAWVGLSPEEYKVGGPALRDAYSDIGRSGLFEREESPLLDSWFLDREHFWLAVPGQRAEPVPLVVFVHGNGGTFQFYPWLLARAATERGFAMAFVSNGFGFWGGPDSAGRIGRVVDAASAEVPVDRSRISLVGLSAGGPGMFAAALAEPGRYRSIAALSCVFPDLIGAQRLGASRVLILHGTEDPRASIDGARRAARELGAAGVPVELVEEAGEGHLAFLTRREKWVPRLLDWLACQARNR